MFASEIRWGYLAAEPARVGHGINPVFAGSFFDEENEPVDGYLKDIGAGQILRELAAELVARSLSLPVAASYLVVCPDGLLPLLNAPAAPERAGQRGRVLFATRAAGLSVARRFPEPNLSGRPTDEAADLMGAALEAFRALLSGWRDLDPAVVFDEWIANDDRNWGNLVIDNRGAITLIDHERAFGGPVLSCATLDPAMECVNRLLDWMWIGTGRFADGPAVDRCVDAALHDAAGSVWREGFGRIGGQWPDILPEGEGDALSSFLDHRRDLVDGLLRAKLFGVSSTGAQSHG